MIDIDLKRWGEDIPQPDFPLKHRLPDFVYTKSILKSKSKENANSLNVPIFTSPTPFKIPSTTRSPKTNDNYALSNKISPSPVKFSVEIVNDEDDINSTQLYNAKSTIKPETNGVAKKKVVNSNKENPIDLDSSSGSDTEGMDDIPNIKPKEKKDIEDSSTQLYSSTQSFGKKKVESEEETDGEVEEEEEEPCTQSNDCLPPKFNAVKSNGIVGIPKNDVKLTSENHFRPTEPKEKSAPSPQLFGQKKSDKPLPSLFLQKMHDKKEAHRKEVKKDIQGVPFPEVEDNLLLKANNNNKNNGNNTNNHNNGMSTATKNNNSVKVNVTPLTHKLIDQKNNNLPSPLVLSNTSRRAQDSINMAMGHNKTQSELLKKQRDEKIAVKQKLINQVKSIQQSRQEIEELTAQINSLKDKTQQEENQLNFLLEDHPEFTEEIFQMLEGKKQIDVVVEPKNDVKLNKQKNNSSNKTNSEHEEDPIVFTQSQPTQKEQAESNSPIVEQDEIRSADELIQSDPEPNMDLDVTLGSIAQTSNESNQEKETQDTITSLQSTPNDGNDSDDFEIFPTQRNTSIPFSSPLSSQPSSMSSTQQKMVEDFAKEPTPDLHQPEMNESNNDLPPNLIKRKRNTEEPDSPISSKTQKTPPEKEEKNVEPEKKVQKKEEAKKKVEGEDKTFWPLQKKEKEVDLKSSSSVGKVEKNEAKEKKKVQFEESTISPKKDKVLKESEFIRSTASMQTLPNISLQKLSGYSMSGVHNRIATAHENGYVKFWKVTPSSSNSPIGKVDDGSYIDFNKKVPGIHISATAFSPSGNVVACVTRKNKPNKQLIYVKQPNFPIIKTTWVSAHPHEGDVSCVTFIEDQKVLTGGEDGRVMLWTIAETKSCVELQKQPSNVNCLSYQDETSTIFSGNNRGELRTWDVNHSRGNNIYNGFDAISHILSSPKDSNQILFTSVSSREQFNLVDLRSKAKTNSFSVNEMTSYTVEPTWHSDGNFIAVGLGKFLNIWDLRYLSKTSQKMDLSHLNSGNIIKSHFMANSPKDLITFFDDNAVGISAIEF
eukprot:TRINITY_DN2969_c0_g2_i1.p1 TRINITY_DN2969_c0_g2~~TRINITY_DN2969_c0_g2_i1.p1  ORF type:complete len:1047 (+),score=358.58 TRINITY_DN2969_c0_g2_i1:133-3273(+)